MTRVAVAGSFDDLRSRHIRFLQEASRIGGGAEVHVQLWSDRMVEQFTGKPPKFPEVERHYFVQSLRYVTTAAIVNETAGGAHGVVIAPRPDVWAVEQAADHA